MNPLPTNNIFSLGSTYAKLWPLDKRLGALFPEPRIIKLTQLANRFMPPLACMILVLHVILQADLLPAITTILFACSLPFQGFYWLGKRARQPLPLHLID